MKLILISIIPLDASVLLWEFDASLLEFHFPDSCTVDHNRLEP